MAIVHGHSAERELCRCYLPLDSTGDAWWPRRDAEPEPAVRAVALYGEDPVFLHIARVDGGWHVRGRGGLPRRAHATDPVGAGRAVLGRGRAPGGRRN